MSDIDIGDLVSLNESVYGAASGVVIEVLGPDVRIIYTESDGALFRIRRRADSLTILRKKQKTDE